MTGPTYASSYMHVKEEEDYLEEQESLGNCIL